MAGDSPVEINLLPSKENQYPLESLKALALNSKANPEVTKKIQEMPDSYKVFQMESIQDLSHFSQWAKSKDRRFKVVAYETEKNKLSLMDDISAGQLGPDNLPIKWRKSRLKGMLTGGFDAEKLKISNGGSGKESKIDVLFSRADKKLVGSQLFVVFDETPDLIEVGETISGEEGWQPEVRIFPDQDISPEILSKFERRNLETQLGMDPDVEWVGLPGRDALDVYIEREVINKMKQYIDKKSEADLERIGNHLEHGMLCFGKRFVDERTGRLSTVITRVIPAFHSDEHGADVTFTADTWAAVNNINEQLSDMRHDGEIEKGIELVGWYHSHPNFGTFLSIGHDTFIQDNYFKEPAQVAIVYDPVRGEFDVFSPLGRTQLPEKPEKKEVSFGNSRIHRGYYVFGERVEEV